ncbi:MoaD/ThiS family protein [Thermoflexus hugenholtzii]|jgi:ThiS family.|uniref:ThiS family protein n=1 Tax=Thermoflexus hugenholtzii JAD2 TaxID=877466 RepID=A0A212QZG9_9CHLR|nr:MoaD/ThiS family protein [Thermoflexus hugenholtzii]SNB65142.1 ThiS family protein [Thermoflexus hugenholtzii JAD2]
MQVTAKLHAILRRYRPTGIRDEGIPVEIPEGGTPRDVAAALGIPLELIHAVFVNEVQATLDTPLQPGDVVRLFPPVVGGAE